MLNTNPIQYGNNTVSIRLTHQRTTVFIPTGIQAESKQIKRGEISDPHILATLHNRILEFRSFLIDLGVSAEQYTAGELKDYLLKKESDKHKPIPTGILFKKFWEEEFIDTIKQPGTRGLYKISLRRFSKFLQADDINTSDMNLNLILRYEDWLRKEGVGPRGVNLYMTHLKRVFSFARDMYNDEDTGRIVIVNNPFSKYKVPSPPPPKREGDLDKEQLLAIINCEVSGVREALAKDCFIMSLFLAGINAVDLYFAENLSDSWVLEYERAKTKTRRQDHAVQRITVPEPLRPLFEKYKDPAGKRVLNLYRRFSEHSNLNQSINKGLKEIGNKVGIPGLYFYQARHSFATIAHNELGFSMEDIGKCLTHVPIMQVTSSYIKNDYSIVDKVNQAVIDYVLG